MSDAELETNSTAITTELYEGPFPGQLLVTESDYRFVGDQNDYKPSAITMAWNKVHMHARSYDHHKDWLSRTKPDTDLHASLSEWVDSYSFIDGLYVAEGYLSAFILCKTVDSRELLQVPRVSTRSFRLTEAIVDRIYGPRY